MLLFMRTLCVVIAVLLWNEVYGEVCGSEPKRNCHKSCHKQCKNRVDKEGDNIKILGVKESISTEFNLCINNCYGDAYIPLKYSDVPNLPDYSDFQQCLGRCAYPLKPNYCLNGYLSSFFYCDCHACCQSSANPDKCIFGCYLWFKRLWSPNAAEGCRYRPEYRHSKKTYCTDVCTWAVLKKESSLTLNDIPTIITGQAKICIERCTTLLLRGFPVDYDTSIQPCSDLTKCISASAIEFSVSITYTLDDAYIKAHSTLLTMIDYHFTNQNAITLHRGPFHNETVQNTFKIHRSPALDHMHNSGIPVHSAKNVKRPQTRPSSVSVDFPWKGHGMALVTSYDYGPSSSVVTNGTMHFIASRFFNLEPCTEVWDELLAYVAEDIRVEHEVLVKIEDTNGLFPLTAAELKNLISQKSEWADLEFVSNSSDHAIVMKGKGYALARYGYEFAPVNNTCKPITGCNHQRTPGETNFCRVNDTSYGSYDDSFMTH